MTESEEILKALPIRYPSYHCSISLMSIQYDLHSFITSSWVNPRALAILPGVIMDYSRKLFNADSVLYFFIGRIPVRYAPAKTSSDSCVLNKRRSSITYSSRIVGATPDASPFIFRLSGNSRQIASHSSIMKKNFSPVASRMADRVSIRSELSLYLTSGNVSFNSSMIFSCITLTILSPSSGLAVKDVTSR